MADARRLMAGWVLAGLSVFVIGGLALTPGCGSGQAESVEVSQGEGKADQASATQAVTLNGRAFELELALNEAEREQGLSDRKTIAADGGMLFVFPQPVKTQFVMRRCYVPIDLIFIDRKGYIDSLHRMEVIEPIGGRAWNNPLRGYGSAGAIQYAIELKGGTLDELGLKRGEKIELPLDALQSRAE